MVPCLSIVKLIHVNLPAVLLLKEPHVWLTTVEDAMLDGCSMARRSPVNVKVNMMNEC